MELIVPLNVQGGRPLYEQIYQYIKDEIRKGNIRPEKQLPSSRELAKSLKVSGIFRNSGTAPAINGKVDHLIGLKENVIIGKLIPAGTGMKRYRNIKLSTGEIEDKIQEQEAPVAEEPQEETDAPLEEADKIILNEDDTQDVDE